MIEIVDIPLYKCSVVFLIESTIEEWKEFFDKQYKEEKLQSSNDSDVREEFELNTPGFVFTTGLNDYICYISDVNNAGLVAHELFHVANAALQDKGVELDLKGEAYAYLIEYLTNEFYNLAYDIQKQKEEPNKP